MEFAYVIYIIVDCSSYMIYIYIMLIGVRMSYIYIMSMGDGMLWLRRITWGNMYRKTKITWVLREVYIVYMLFIEFKHVVYWRWYAVAQNHIIEMVCCGSESHYVRFDSTRCDAIRFDYGMLGLIWIDSIRLGYGMLGSTRIDSIRLD